MTHLFRIAVSAGVLVLVGSQTVRAQDLTYWNDLRPVFRKYCTVCHSTKNLKEPDVSGGLALDSYEAARKGSKRPVIEPGKGDASLLVQLLLTKDEKKRMPLDADPLPAETIALVKRWIDSGAKEGTRPELAPDPVVTKKAAANRKLDVALKTQATPPAGILVKGVGGALEYRIKAGPLAPVAAVAFSPDGKLLASASYGQVVIWDLASARAVRALTNVLGAVNDLRFSPDGALLAVAGGQPAGKGDIRLYQVADWKLRDVLRGHDDVVFCVAFSPDGKSLASASFDHTVRLWNLANFETIRTYASHSDFVYAVAFSPDGKRLASAGKDRAVKLIDAETGKGIFTFSGMEQDVMAVAYSPDGKAIVSSGFEAGIYWWNPETGTRLKVQGGHGVAVQELCFSKDGKRLISAGADQTVRIWDGTSGNLLRTIGVGSPVYAAAISANGKGMASGSFDGLVKLWDESNGRLLATFLALPAQGDSFDWLALTPEGHAASSDKMMALGQWLQGGAQVPAPRVWQALRNPDQVARALRGEAVPAPKFEAK